MARSVTFEIVKRFVVVGRKFVPVENVAIMQYHLFYELAD